MASHPPHRSHRRGNARPSKRRSSIHDPQFIEEIEITVHRRAVLHRLGDTSDGLKSFRLGDLLAEELDRSRELIHPRGAIRHVAIDSSDGKRVVFSPVDFVVESSHVAKLLKRSPGATLFMVTIGLPLERHVETLMAQGEIVRGYILDAIGSEAAEATAAAVHGTIGKWAAQKGLTTTPRFSPGYGDWGLSVQKDILRLTQGKKIGITVNRHAMMMPRKSVSAIVGWREGR